MNTKSITNITGLNNLILGCRTAPSFNQLLIQIWEYSSCWHKLGPWAIFQVFSDAHWANQLFLRLCLLVILPFPSTLFFHFLSLPLFLFSLFSYIDNIQLIVLSPYLISHKGKASPPLLNKTISFGGLATWNIQCKSMLARTNVVSGRTAASILTGTSFS